MRGSRTSVSAVAPPDALADEAASLVLALPVPRDNATEYSDEADAPASAEMSRGAGVGSAANDDDKDAAAESNTENEPSALLLSSCSATWRVHEHVRQRVKNSDSTC